MSNNELNLWSANSKDVGVFEKLFHQNYAPVVRFANNFLLDVSTSEDDVQSAFVNLWKHRKDLQISNSERAYLFQSVKNYCLNHLRPFIVRSGNISIKVYGISFNVNSYDNEENIATTPVEGKVKVFTADNKLEEELKPREQTIYSKNLFTIEKKSVDIGEFTSWKEGRFYFRSMRMDQINKILLRWYDVNFEFKNDDIRSLRFNGNSKRYNNI